MPSFDEPVKITDDGKIKAILTDGGLTVFKDKMADGMFGGLADGMHILATQMWISEDGNFRLFVDAANNSFWIGGGGEGGDIVLLPSGAQNGPKAKVERSTIQLAGQSGTIVFRSADKHQVTARVEGPGGNLWLGGNGTDGDVVLHPSTVDNAAGTEMSTIHLSAQESRITLRSGGKPTVVIDGKAGDIVLPNADCAEDFDVDDASVEPGSVLVVGDDGRLRTTDRCYDRRVAGVVSGAGELRPGVVLGRRADAVDTVPIGLAGRVYCKVDATRRDVESGDLLTTSENRGHAMAIDDPARAFGAVLGKALAPMRGETGLIPILVSLQ